MTPSPSSRASWNAPRSHEVATVRDLFERVDVDRRELKAVANAVSEWRRND
jgi:hypothetical protein